MGSWNRILIFMQRDGMDGKVGGWAAAHDGFVAGASWLPDHHVFRLPASKLGASASWRPAREMVFGCQCKLAARFCQIMMLLAASASWLPDHDASGYQRKLAAGHHASG